MKATNTNIIGFNCMDIGSASALEAYQIYANEMEGLLAIVVFQFDRYQAGEGKVMWVKDKKGIEIPVVSACYSISWDKDVPNSGPPARIARIINEDAMKAKAEGKPFYHWADT